MWTVGTAWQDSKGFPGRKGNLQGAECLEVSLNCVRVKNGVQHQQYLLLDLIKLSSFLLLNPVAKFEI